MNSNRFYFLCHWTICLSSPYFYFNIPVVVVEGIIQRITGDSLIQWLLKCFYVSAKENKMVNRTAFQVAQVFLLVGKVALRNKHTKSLHLLKRRHFRSGCWGNHLRGWCLSSSVNGKKDISTKSRGWSEGVQTKASTSAGPEAGPTWMCSRAREQACEPALLALGSAVLPVVSIQLLLEN